MPRTRHLSARERLTSLGAVLAIHAGLALLLLRLSGHIAELPAEQPVTSIFDVYEEPVPPPVVEVEQPEAAPEEEGAAAPENIRSQAAPVVAPEPEIVLPVPPPVVAAPEPAAGPDPSQGASDRPGPGSGAGGIGSGSGAGGAGAGAGGGGAGGEGTRPTLISRSLRARDYPRELRDRWPPGGRVLVTFDVQVDGRATGCRVYQSSGDWQIDAETCRLVETRLRFRPATDQRGQPTVAKYGYMQAPVNF